MLNVIMQTVIMLNVITLSVIMLNVIVPNVMAPFEPLLPPLNVWEKSLELHSSSQTKTRFQIVGSDKHALSY